MLGRKLILAAASSVVFLTAGQVAHAQQVRTAKALPQMASAPTYTLRDAFAPDLNQWGPSVGRRTLQWDSKKARWGVKLDLDQAVGRPLSYTDRDVQAGAFYKITPSFRVGGAVSLGAMGGEETPQAIPADKAPKVRLETAFKF